MFIIKPLKRKLMIDAADGLSLYAVAPSTDLLLRQRKDDISIKKVAYLGEA